MACRRSGHGDGYGRGKQTGGPCSVVAVTGHGAHRNSSVIPRWLGGRGVCQAVCLAPTSYSAVVTVRCVWGRQKRWQQKGCARQLSASLLGGRRRATHGGRGRFRSLTLLGATVDSDYFWVGPVMREGERRRLPSRAKPSDQTGKRGPPSPSPSWLGAYAPSAQCSLSRRAACHAPGLASCRKTADENAALEARRGRA